MTELLSDKIITAGFVAAVGRRQLKFVADARLTADRTSKLTSDVEQSVRTRA